MWEQGDKSDEDDIDDIDKGQPVELGNTFEGFQAFYKNFLQIKQQIYLQNFVAIGAEDKYDNVLTHFKFLITFSGSSVTLSIKQKKCRPKV